jgi:endonuclease/exonuclease/phosphatase family metal-dependent hydrolase
VVQIDHILYRGRLDVVSAGAWTASEARRASDHLPVVAEFARAGA